MLENYDMKEGYLVKNGVKSNVPLYLLAHCKISELFGDDNELIQTVEYVTC